MIGRFFYFISSILFLSGVFIVLSPALLIPDLIYPVRIDSTYLAFHAPNEGDSGSMLLTPADVNLPYADLQVTAIDNIKLNGWFVAADDTPANTILLIHDINESKILYIDQLKQFHDRGFNVCIFDLRAHGTSGGTEFSPGVPSVDDVKRMTDTVVARKGTRNMVFMGVGLGAAIALQASVYDERCRGLVLQSPFNTYANYLGKYAESKWGAMKNIWYPVLLRRSESLLQYPVRELDLREIAAYTSIPTFFIIGSEDKKVFTSETLQVFDASGTEKKELILVRDAGHEDIAKEGGETYYNRITAFLLNTLPRESRTTRYKKLASNDH